MTTTDEKKAIKAEVHQPLSIGQPAGRGRSKKQQAKPASTERSDGENDTANKLSPAAAAAKEQRKVAHVLGTLPELSETSTPRRRLGHNSKSKKGVQSPDGELEPSPETPNSGPTTPTRGLGDSKKNKHGARANPQTAATEGAVDHLTHRRGVGGSGSLQLSLPHSSSDAAENIPAHDLESQNEPPSNEEERQLFAAVDPEFNVPAEAEQLAVAFPVPDRLPQAEPMPSQAHKKAIGGGLGCRLVIGLGALAIVIAAVIAAIVTTRGESGAKSGTSISGMDHAPITKEEKILSLLPDYTVAAIDRHFNAEGSKKASPQTKAWNWTINDPYLEHYEDWRIVQRFALVTLFFATGGEEKWYERTDWLSYEVEEYEWYNPNFVTSGIEAEYWEWLPAKLEDLFLDDVEELSLLWLHNNGLSGSLPAEFYLLSSLRFVDFSQNHLTGPLSSAIGDFQRLEFLVMRYNDFTGTLPSEIGMLSSLLWVMNEGNSFTGALPSEIGMMQNVWVFVLQENSFHSIPSEIGLMSSLVLLEIGRNDLTCQIPSQIGLLTSTRTVSFVENQLVGTVPPEICQIATDIDWSKHKEKFDELFFGYGDFLVDNLDSILKNNMDMPYYLALASNRLTGSLPCIGDFTNLDWLVLQKNDFTGTLPSEVGMITQLQVLSLFDTKISGPIPSQIGELEKLSLLYLHRTYLSGTLPTQVGHLTSLETLILNDTALVGPMPEEVCGLSATIYVDCPPFSCEDECCTC